MIDYRASITKISNIHDDITTGLEFIKWKDTIHNDTTVFIKPNFTYPFYKEGVTTNPLVLKEVLAILKDRAGRVIVGESDGANHSFTADQAFKGHGMSEICKETGAELINLSTYPSRYIEETIQGKKVTVQVPEFLIDEIDCLISIPVLKVHANTIISLSMKNLWGCYPDSMRCLHHKYLSRKLTLLTKVLNLKIALIDGTYALNGHGPMYGEAIKTNLLITANNPVVADSFGTAIMGIPISKIDHILTAEKEGLGITNLNAVQFNDDWKKYQMQFQVNRTIIDRLSMILFKSECIAKLVMDSPLKPTIYGVVQKLRNNEENFVNDQVKRGHK
jgi:uncharacterized protein (DUF362 family)